MIYKGNPPSMQRVTWSNLTNMAKVLVRSSSTPILNSRVPPTPPENDAVSLRRTTSSFTFSLSTTTLSKSHSTHFPLPVPPPPPTQHSQLPRTTSFDNSWIFSTSGLNETHVDAGGSGSDGGRVSGGGRSDGQDFNRNNEQHATTEAYYQRAIEANPDNSLLLTNYAIFLKEVKGDLRKAEEFCERAILANPGDATVLSLYADIVWLTQRDAPRAESYFDQAVQSSPDDCYVLASYAKFLWDAEEEEEEESSPMPAEYWGGGPQHSSPITAASFCLAVQPQVHSSSLKLMFKDQI